LAWIFFVKHPEKSPIIKLEARQVALIEQVIARERRAMCFTVQTNIHDITQTVFLVVLMIGVVWFKKK